MDSPHIESVSKSQIEAPIKEKKEEPIDIAAIKSTFNKIKENQEEFNRFLEGSSQQSKTDNIDKLDEQLRKIEDENPRIFMPRNFSPESDLFRISSLFKRYQSVANFIIKNHTMIANEEGMSMKKAGQNELRGIIKKLEKKVVKLEADQK